MQDPTQLLPQPVLGFLNIFVQVCRVMNHYLGYGIGTFVFLGITISLALVPAIARWTNKVYPQDGSQGMSSDQAQKETNWHFWIAGLLCAFVDGYVLTHGGMVDHPV